MGVPGQGVMFDSPNCIKAHLFSENCLINTVAQNLLLIGRRSIIHLTLKNE
jgi:hypothetical protein